MEYADFISAQYLALGMLLITLVSGIAIELKKAGWFRRVLLEYGDLYVHVKEGKFCLSGINNHTLLAPKLWYVALLRVIIRLAPNAEEKKLITNADIVFLEDVLLQLHVQGRITPRRYAGLLVITMNRRQRKAIKDNKVINFFSKVSADSQAENLPNSNDTSADVSSVLKALIEHSGIKITPADPKRHSGEFFVSYPMPPHTDILMAEKDKDRIKKIASEYGYVIEALPEYAVVAKLFCAVNGQVNPTGESLDDLTAAPQEIPADIEAALSLILREVESAKACGPQEKLPGFWHASQTFEMHDLMWLDELVSQHGCKIHLLPSAGTFACVPRKQTKEATEKIYDLAYPRNY